MPSQSAPSPATATVTWTLYSLTSRDDPRRYVGLTKRPLPVRLNAHDQDARRHPTLGGPDTLAAAIRRTHAKGGSFAGTFKAKILATTTSPAEARRLERHWIERLGTAWPRGFNIRPG